jgi:hypothetical protein
MALKNWDNWDNENVYKHIKKDKIITLKGNTVFIGNSWDDEIDENTFKNRKTAEKFVIKYMKKH